MKLLIDSYLLIFIFFEIDFYQIVIWFQARLSLFSCIVSLDFFLISKSLSFLPTKNYLKHHYISCCKFCPAHYDPQLTSITRHGKWLINWVFQNFVVLQRKVKHINCSSNEKIFLKKVKIIFTFCTTLI